jgi:beta-alanine--pyruvate transaminase
LLLIVKKTGHPAAFQLAVAIIALGDRNHVFLCNSGSEALDTALKIARADDVPCGDDNRLRFISRVQGYHGGGDIG